MYCLAALSHYFTEKQIGRIDESKDTLGHGIQIFRKGDMNLSQAINHAMGAQLFHLVTCVYLFHPFSLVIYPISAVLTEKDLIR